ncbi:MAG: chloramphenicol acetyltransferase [Thermoanaerobaculia bacterium]|nr:chloramphenicol acetyltransferase [Thermoanaerobaculia bacterium]
MGQFLDLDAWPRRQLFDLFRTYEQPFFNVCAPVDVTRLRQTCRTSGAPFFAAYLYLSIRAANEIEPFRYRLRGERVWVHDRIEAGTTVPAAGEAFAFAYVEHAKDFKTFESNFRRERERLEANDDRLEPRDDRDDLIHYSTLPWISFTGIRHARRHDPADSVPKIVFGKTYESEGKLLMPHSVDAHHALMDGLHVGRYFERFQELLDSGVG